jgi:hypothetical protein
VPVRKAVPYFNCKKPQDWIDYYLSLEPEIMKDCVIYVYRLWPVINTAANVDTDKPSTNIEKIYDHLAFSSENWQHELLVRHGSGDYNLYLNYNGKCISRVVVQTPRDLANYPRKLTTIPSYSEDPQNVTFIKWAKTNGFFTPLNDAIEQKRLIETEEEEMSTEAVKQMGNLVEKLIDNQQRPAPEAVVMGRPKEDASIGIKLVQEAASGAIQLIKDTADKQSNANDPLAMVKTVASLIQSFVPAPQPPPDNSPILELLQSQTSGNLRNALPDWKRS